MPSYYTGVTFVRGGASENYFPRATIEPRFSPPLNPTRPCCRATKPLITQNQKRAIFGGGSPAHVWRPLESNSPFKCPYRGRRGTLRSRRLHWLGRGHPGVNATPQDAGGGAAALLVFADWLGARSLVQAPRRYQHLHTTLPRRRTHHERVISHGAAHDGVICLGVD